MLIGGFTADRPRLAFLLRGDLRIIPRPILRAPLAFKDSLDGPLLATIADSVVRRRAVADGHRLYAKPRIRPTAMVSAGYAQEQQVRAQFFDPYPTTESGPLDPGARPRGFQEPPPEVSRGRWLPRNWIRPAY